MTPEPPAEETAPRPARWWQKLSAIMAAVFCFELGVFLVIFPWASQWNSNYGGMLPHWARETWINPYFRGAVSGLGLVNIWIALSEVTRLKRFGPPAGKLQ